MKRLRQKLISQSGASITYALLLFVVCAAVSAVVLTAATAAAGRMSKLKENDNRFYCVTSAAEVLRKELDGGSTTIVFDGSNMIKFNSGESLPVSMGIIDFASAAAEGLVSNKVELTLSPSPAGDESVTVLETVTGGENPSMTLDVSSTNASEGIFTLRLTFSAGKEEIPKKKKDADGNVTILTTKKYTWNYYGIETVGLSSE